MKMRFLFLLLLPLVLCSCGLSPQQKADYAAVNSSGVTPAIYDKMLHGDALSVADIRNLVRARVNESIVVRYVRDHDTVYFLSSYDIDSLRKAGATDSLVDYLLNTGRYGYGYEYPGYYDYPDVSIGLGFGSYWGDGYRGGRGWGGHHWR